MNILKLDSSAMGDYSATKQLTSHLVDLLKEQNKAPNIVTRDLSQSNLPLLDAQTVGAFYTPTEALSEEQNSLIALSDQLVDELKLADVIVIGAPMHNFSVNGYLKAYIDQVARVGKTFSYSEAGPKGLLENKKVYVMVASGGDYSSGPLAALDHLTPYLKTVLGFIGLTDVAFIQCPGTSASDEAKAQAIEVAKTSLSQALLAA